MRERSLQSRLVPDDEVLLVEPRSGGLAGALGRRLARRPLETIGALVAALMSTAIIVNALYFQPGPHPSPLASSSPAREMTGSLSIVPQPRTATAHVTAGETPAARTRVQLLTEIQRELAGRGFYDGAIDGIFGPKMDAAIREFEQASGKRPTGEPSESLLAALKRSTLKERAKATPPRRAETGTPAPAPAPSRRVAAVQRALSDFGYGQLKLSGVVDEATKSAIEKFERERKLPVRGQLSERLLRELAAVTGRPLE